MEWIIVMGVAFGIVCAIIAQSKDRSGGAWFFLGFLFGVFGLIVLICLPSLKPKEPQIVYIRQEPQVDPKRSEQTVRRPMPRRYMTAMEQKAWRESW